MPGTAGISTQDAFPADPAAMVSNLKKHMVDCVLSYPYWHGDKCKLATKTAVTAGTARKYVDQLSAYWQVRSDN